MSEPLRAERDWDAWQPTERATLCFVLRGEEILLIRKKRGLGAGKVNGPGGRLEPGESEAECAIRETQEELCVTPLEPEWRGELHFQFLDGYGLHCAVFTASDCEGEAEETDEAAPLWTRLDAIPFDEMWADDVHWLPGVLAGRNFRGYFDFDGETMLTRRIEWLDRQSRPVAAQFK
jgi:8-oxo-dGTP diphosphatase